MLLSTSFVGTDSQSAALNARRRAAAISTEAVPMVPIGHRFGIGQQRAVVFIQQKGSLPQVLKPTKLDKVSRRRTPFGGQTDGKVRPIPVHPQQDDGLRRVNPSSYVVGQEKNGSRHLV